VTKRIVLILIGLAAVIGLLDPFACRWYSMRTSLASVTGMPANGLPSRPLPKSARAHLLDTAKRALAMLPVPSASKLDPESVEASADEKALWAETGFVHPGTARADRTFEPYAGGYADGTPPALEQRVFVNTEVSLPTGLASVGGSPRLFEIPGAVGVEVTTVLDTEDSESGTGDGGRMAVPMSPASKRMAITIVRVLLANSKTENIFRSGISEGEMPSWHQPPPKKPGEIQTLVIELYGGKADVESLARRLPVADLRKLLDQVP
jgi:hypothetical protein